MSLKKYITSQFLALSEDAGLNTMKNLKFLVKESQTKGGLNEQGLKELKKRGFYRSFHGYARVSMYNKIIGSTFT